MHGNQIFTLDGPSEKKDNRGPMSNYEIVGTFQEFIKEFMEENAFVYREQLKNNG